jgi:hypothetical protein
MWCAAPSFLRRSVLVFANGIANETRRCGGDCAGADDDHHVHRQVSKTRQDRMSCGS